MKSESIHFNTRKTVQEIINVLNSFKCRIDRVQPDPFAQKSADIEVVMIGMATMADAAKSVGAGKSGWGVQVYVYDMGKYRSVELVALGESGFKYAMTEGRDRGALDNMINGQDYLNIRHSRRYRDRIKDKLEPVKSAPKGASDASKSRLLKSAKSLSGINDDALADRIFAAMPLSVERFLDNHPDYSEKDALAMDCAAMYNLSGNMEKSSEMARTSGYDANTSDILPKIVGSMPEILRYSEDDSAAGNDRSALYTVAYYLSVYEKGGNNMQFLLYNLLDKVLKLENSGANIDEDLKIWPLLARNCGFMDWHASKYGDDGTAGRFDQTDPAVIGAKSSSLVKTAPTPQTATVSEAKVASGSAAAKAAGLGTAAAAAAAVSGTKDQAAAVSNDGYAGEQGQSAGISSGSKQGKSGAGLPFDKKYLILAAAFLAVIALTAIIVSSISKTKYEDAAVAAEDPETEFIEEDGSASEDAETAAGSAYADFDTRRVYAHRGVGGEEETFGSYDSAIAQGAVCIEQDVILSGGDLYVSYVYKEPSELESEGKLRLSDVFDRYGKNIYYLIEIKTRDMDTVNALVDLVQSYDLENNVMVQNFDYGNGLLQEVKSRMPRATTVYLVDQKHGGEDGFNNAINSGYVDIVAVSYEEGMMDQKHCSAAHEAGKTFCAWVLDDETTVRKAIDMGVDSYFTRYPEMALNLEREYRN